MISPLPGLDPRTISFCDELGNYLQTNASGDAQVDATGKLVYGPNCPSSIPNFVPLQTDVKGVATFYLRGGFLSQRMNEIRLAVEDTTTK